MHQSSYVLPGQILGSTSEYRSGPGTHIFRSQIIASRAGYSAPITDSSPPLPLMTISHQDPNDTMSGANPAHPDQRVLLPSVGASVLAQITRINPVRGADCLIHAVAPGPAPLLQSAPTANSTSPRPSRNFIASPLPHPALIQPTHLRQLQTPAIPIHDLVRAGDVVKARVLAVGDGSQYYLSLAGTENGVVMARGEGGGNGDGDGEGGGWMAASSWREMRDGRTGRVEGRKVARPVGLG